MGMRLSDPKPAYCSACFNSTPDARFVDFDASYDSGAFVDRETQAYVEGSDDLHLCDGCVGNAMELLGVQPELHARQREEIRKRSAGERYWRDYARRLEATLQDRPERS